MVDIIDNQYKIKKDYIENNTKRRSGKKINKVVFIVAHDTGNPNSTAQQNVDYYKKSANVTSGSAHIFVDDKEIIECIPFSEKAWHVWYQKPLDNKLYGDDANDIAIGVELCYGDNINFKEAYKRYVWIINKIIVDYDLDATKCIIGHEKLDPERRSDPSNALKTGGLTYEKLLQDIVDFNNLYNMLDKLKGVKYMGDSLQEYVLTNSGIYDTIEEGVSNEGSEKMTFEKIILKKGTKHNAVRALQDSLNDLGYNVGVVDGDFGSKTDTAVRQFQRDNGLDDDGIVGKYTLSMLDKRLNELRNETIEQVNEQPTEQVKEYKCVKEGWRIRSEASLDKQSIRGSLSYGDTIKVLKTVSGKPYGGSDKWYKYEWNGHVAHSHSLGFVEKKEGKTLLIVEDSFELRRNNPKDITQEDVKSKLYNLDSDDYINGVLYNPATMLPASPMISDGKVYQRLSHIKDRKVSAICYTKQGTAHYVKVSNTAKDIADVHTNKLIKESDIEWLFGGIGLGGKYLGFHSELRNYKVTWEGYTESKGACRYAYHAFMVLTNKHVYRCMTTRKFDGQDIGFAVEKIFENYGEKVLGIVKLDGGGSAKTPTFGKGYDGRVVYNIVTVK